MHVTLLPGLSPLFLHTASDQKLEAGTAWEQSYLGNACYDMFLGLESLSHEMQLQSINRCHDPTNQTLVLGTYISCPSGIWQTSCYVCTLNY